MKKILFQGDSITDAGRSRENLADLGPGYTRLIASYLGFENPGEYEFVNRGIGGNRIPCLYSRRENDIFALNPDYMSILIGVNDVWHGLDLGEVVTPEEFEEVYGKLIEETKALNPNVKIMLMEPFILHGHATDYSPKGVARWDEFREGVEIKAAIVKKLAEKYDLKFVPLQKELDAAAENAPAGFLSGDGVHPSIYGNELIKRQWLKAFEEIK